MALPNDFPNESFSSLMSEFLRSEAYDSCVDVYNDFSWAEVERMSPSIQECWKVGEKIKECRL